MNERIREDRRFPLKWPDGWPRTQSPSESRFSKNRTMTQARDDLLAELDRMSARDVIISTNLELRHDNGLPRSGQNKPRDPGVACYFKRQNSKGNLVDVVLACDRWNAVECNLYALAKHVEALRGQDRWGVGTLDQAFNGYLALPAHGPRPWREVLGFSNGLTVTLADVNTKYTLLARAYHPDAATGDSEKMANLNVAIKTARDELAR